MSGKKIEKVTRYVENKGRGKVVIVDSAISVQDFPSKTAEGKQAIGIYATPVEVVKGKLKGFEGMVKARHSHQLNILSVEEYEKKVAELKEAAKAPPSETEETESPPSGPTEKDIFDAAMSGGDDEIMAYMEAYPEGQYTNDVIERSTFLTAKVNNTKKAFTDYMKKYPQGKYVNEVNQLLGTN